MSTIFIQSFQRTFTKTIKILRVLQPACIEWFFKLRSFRNKQIEKGMSFLEELEQLECLAFWSMTVRSFNIPPALKTDVRSAIGYKNYATNTIPLGIVFVVALKPLAVPQGTLYPSF